MYAAAFSEWARIGRTPRSLKCNRVRRSVDSTKKTWLIPVPARARANHSAPFIAALSLMLCPPCGLDYPSFVEAVLPPVRILRTGRVTRPSRAILQPPERRFGHYSRGGHREVTAKPGNHLVRLFE